MESFYIFIVVILFLLAISDLIVGVSNDAVNFLNSAIGSKAAPFRAIMIVAAAGVLVGATFSSGMMEVARKGIMHPDQFYFGEIMLIFLAVMMTDIILLDLYNTFGLPTSTTVSIVFELLGASVALSIIKMNHLGQPISEMGQYINSDKALMIISGILLSVVIAFAVGAIVQYLSRLWFSFNFEKSYKRYGSLFGGLALSAITYFMLIKGAKGSSFITAEALDWIKTHTWIIILISFAGWTIIFQMVMWFTRVNLFKIIVMVGTFSLAMAFAGNDLVNFIGVPLAGFESLKTYLADPSLGADGLLMTSLTEKVKTPTLFLLLAGLIMVITLWTSRKARSVTKTTVDLSRQGEGYERFASTGLSRTIVRITRGTHSATHKILPNSIIRTIEKRFEPLPEIDKDQAKSFDLLRASVNLVVAAILIAIGTSLKLPLSTTYVTFMVAMGTSLADRAWGRESAVYRITGVITVITGWFLTAFLAFSASFLIASFIHWGGLIAIILLVVVTVVLALRTQYIHRKRAAKTDEAMAKYTETEELLPTDMLQKCKNNVVELLNDSKAQFSNIVAGLKNEDRKHLKKTIKQIKAINGNAKNYKDEIPKTIEHLQEENLETGHYYIQVLDYLREVAHCLTFIANPAFEHVDNNHKSLLADQIIELENLSEEISQFVTHLIEIIQADNFEQVPSLADEQQNILNLTDKLRKQQLKRLKTEQVGTRNSMLYISLLHETRSLLLHLQNLVKSFRDFVLNQ